MTSCPRAFGKACRRSSWCSAVAIEVMLDAGRCFAWVSSSLEGGAVGEQGAHLNRRSLMSDVEYEGTPDEEEGVENDPEQSGDSEEEDDDDDDDDDDDVRLGGDRDATFED